MNKIILIITLMIVATMSSADYRIHNDFIMKEYFCMVQNLHFEARGEGRKGILAVANVVLNRVGHPGYPDTVCGVVHQKSQFSWVGQHKPKDLNKVSSVIKQIAYDAIVNKNIEDITKGALFFKVRKAPSSWDHSRLTKTVTIGNHDFFRPR